MTGSGSSADPYIVTSYGELVQTASQANKCIEFPKEPRTINIEDEYGKSEPPELEIGAGTTINGNNWTIHGLWGKTHNCISDVSTTSQHSSYLSNINFSSFHSQNNYFMTGKTTPPQIENCIFSGKCEKDFMKAGSYYSYNTTRNPSIRKSSMTIDFTLLTSPYFIVVENFSNMNFLTLSDCNIKLTSVGDLTLFNFTRVEKRIDIQNCCFDLTSNNCHIFNGSSSSTIISGCTFVGNSQTAIDIGDGTPQTVNAFDGDAFPNAVRSRKFVGVPRDKIGDAAYLSSIGLPIGVSDV